MRIASVVASIFLTLQHVEGFVAHRTQSSAASVMKNHVMSLSSQSTTNAAAAASTEVEPMTEDFNAAFEQVRGALVAAIETPSMEAPLVHFTKEYFTACSNASAAGVGSVTPKSTSENMMNAMKYAMEYGLNNKFTFGVTHKAMRGDPDEEDGNTIDFYKFGCDFFRPSMDLEKSVVLGQDALKQAMDQMNKGENVIFFANHQSEADPQVMSCLLEKAGFGKDAENLVYVAGHKVTTDTLAIPFSMGRNLICIHSKKHIDADPETKPIKSKQNLASMNGMLKMMKKGGACIWVAPSGGRDRRDLETGKVPLAPFDQKTIDMFRLMGNKAKKPIHYYALSMVTYDLCPPPDVVEAGTGEQRNVRFVPVAIKVSDELENVGGVESRHLFTDHALEVTQEGYEECLKALGME